MADFGGGSVGRICVADIGEEVLYGVYGGFWW